MTNRLPTVQYRDLGRSQLAQLGLNSLTHRKAGERRPTKSWLFGAIILTIIGGFINDWFKGRRTAVRIWSSSVTDPLLTLLRHSMLAWNIRSIKFSCSVPERPGCEQS
jgi:hypothetical protein